MNRWNAFKTRVPGKWVLAGEHAVLRGGTAVALPHPELALSFEFAPGGDGLRVTPSEAQTVVQDLLLAIRESWEEEGRSFLAPEGELTLASTIPTGAGLGSSAALCVALTRWVAEPMGIPREEWLGFARQLEHRFHGRSSGMDVAVVSAGEPISFTSGSGSIRASVLGIRKLPRFTFHDTGLRARTSECVFRVERLREETPLDAMKIDEAMNLAARQAMEGLFAYDRGDPKGGLAILAEGIRGAQECFYRWGLVPNEARRIAEELVDQGALAAKLTGAGGGGFVVALWN